MTETAGIGSVFLLLPPGEGWGEGGLELQRIMLKRTRPPPNPLPEGEGNIQAALEDEEDDGCAEGVGFSIAHAMSFQPATFVGMAAIALDA